ncbi:MAG: VOC family protein [Bifidobacteriaceae bacterium]|jgi:predicted enzyme related to lactoylglutathione lyase|nr:VOC family protein [Bifidobacteriaceae bacterium]
MSVSIQMVTFDSADPRPLAEWWAQQTDGNIVADMDGFFIMVHTPGGLNLGFQKVADPTPGKNRLHLDTGASDPEAEVDRLVAAGATLVAIHNEDPTFTWTVLADPEGNQFCVAAMQQQ